MFSECLRFEDMLDFVVRVYYTGGSLNNDLGVNNELTKMHNNWGNLTKKLEIHWFGRYDEISEIERMQCQNLWLVSKACLGDVDV